MSEALKSCPICGGALEIYPCSYNSVKPDDFGILCQNEECWLESVGTFPSREAAITAANTRPTSTIEEERKRFEDDWAAFSGTVYSHSPEDEQIYKAMFFQGWLAAKGGE